MRAFFLIAIVQITVLVFFLTGTALYRAVMVNCPPFSFYWKILFVSLSIIIFYLQNEAEDVGKSKKFGATENVKRAALADLKNRGIVGRTATGKDAAQKV